jgi:hypothetical protein
VTSDAPAPQAGSGQQDTSVVLIDVLVSSLEALAATGQVDEACRLAGRACAALRGRNPTGWRRFNVFLHRMSPRLP